VITMPWIGRSHFVEYAQPATAVPDGLRGTERRPAETRHRFANTRDVTDTGEHPQRLIIERDRRLGGRASFDPPR
jgi:hypothetical protein